MLSIDRTAVSEYGGSVFENYGELFIDVEHKGVLVTNTSFYISSHEEQYPWTEVLWGYNNHGFFPVVLEY